jgi:hypothetical protein
MSIEGIAMKTTLSLRDFDLHRFIDIVVEFWGGDHEVAFPFVHDGVADFGTICLGDDADDAGDSPLEWLQHGHTLFGQLTRGDGVSYELADGTELEINDDDEADDVFLDDCSTYGFLLHLEGDLLTIQFAVLRDGTGEPLVTAVDHTGPFEEPMSRFIKMMTKGNHDRP